MKTYQYQVLRYLPDRISGEFINLGVVVYLPEEKELKSLFYNKTNRIHAFFPSVNTRFIVKSIKSIDSFFKKISTDFQKPLFTELPSSIEDITKQILPKDDSALFFTDAAKILDISAEAVLGRLYERLVVKNVQETDHDSLLDGAVWKEFYKAYFDKYQLTEKLKAASVKTKMDSWNFERTCRNGALHCFEGISFNLSNEENIKRKVYTWAGRIDELKTSKEEIHLYLLTALPEKLELQKFIREKLGKLSLNNSATVELVDVGSAEKVIKKVKKQMEEHI